MGTDSRLLRLVARAAGYMFRAATGEQPSRRPAPRPAAEARDAGRYPGDYQGMPTVGYEPREDDEADPGEVVWTWVPYEEDHDKGKDRPVLVIGRDGPWLLALPVTSKDHDRDVEQEARAGRFWCDIGTGDWDRKRRPSEARVNRIVRVEPSAVRRTGGRLPRDRFDAVVTHMRAHL